MWQASLEPQAEIHLPPIKVIAAMGEEDVTIKVSMAFGHKLGCCFIVVSHSPLGDCLRCKEGPRFWVSTTNALWPLSCVAGGG